MENCPLVSDLCNFLPSDVERGVVVNSYIKGFLVGFKSSGKEVFYARLVKIQKRKMKMLICASVESPEPANMLSDNSSCLKQQS
ncbi:hypothetical protein H6P81_018531 [Aristolochia fimbriata]|uniref:Uncharacterized protein n=1 Tax=Aristolochia fimbriata TaxID=158543 RepID=A0AAV7E5E8_ARIFI|nr:hypothetical protein H6P81_018531 [Aristolochia fimbriata]